VHEVDTASDGADLVDHRLQQDARVRDTCRAETTSSAPEAARVARGHPVRSRLRAIALSPPAMFRSAVDLDVGRLDRRAPVVEPDRRSSSLFTWPPWTISPRAPISAAGPCAAGAATGCGCVVGVATSMYSACTYSRRRSLQRPQTGRAAGVPDLGTLVPLRVAEKNWTCGACQAVASAMGQSARRAPRLGWTRCSYRPS
jgi:hypothetical protein